MIKVYCDINGTYECFDVNKIELIEQFVKLLTNIASNDNEEISFSFCSSYRKDDIKEYVDELSSYFNNRNIRMAEAITRTFSDNRYISKYKNMLTDIKNNFRNYSKVIYIDDSHHLLTSFLSFMENEYSFIKAIAINPNYYEDDKYLFSSKFYSLNGVNESLNKYLNNYDII